MVKNANQTLRTANKVFIIRAFRISTLQQDYHIITDFSDFSSLQFSSGIFLLILSQDNQC